MKQKNVVRKLLSFLLARAIGVYPQTARIKFCYDHMILLLDNNNDNYY